MSPDISIRYILNYEYLSEMDRPDETTLPCLVKRVDVTAVLSRDAASMMLQERGRVMYTGDSR